MKKIVKDGVDNSMRRSKKKKLHSYNRIQTRVIFAIVLIAVAAVMFNSYKTHQKAEKYAAIEAELDSQIAEAEAEKEALKEKEDYMETDAYKEKVAREEFGMIKNGEYILKDKTEE